MGDEKDDLDSQIDKMLASGDGANGAPEATQPVDGSTPGATEEASKEGSTSDAEREEYEVGGRKYTLDGLKRTAEHQFQYIKKIERERAEERKRLDPLIKFDEVLQKDPGRWQAIKRANDEYNRLRAAGATKGEAKRESGLEGVPKELLDRLNKHEEYFQKQEQRIEEKNLDDEIRAFQTSKGVDAKTMDKVLKLMTEYAEQGYDLPMGKAHQIVRLEELEHSGKKTAEELKRVRANADVGSSSHAAVAKSSKKPEDLNDQEFDQEINRFIRERGGA